jgi:hypothetical protein
MRTTAHHDQAPIEGVEAQARPTSPQVASKPGLGEAHKAAAGAAMNWLLEVQNWLPPGTLWHMSRE